MYIYNVGYKEAKVGLFRLLNFKIMTLNCIYLKIINHDVLLNILVIINNFHSGRKKSFLTLCKIGYKYHFAVFTPTFQESASNKTQLVCLTKERQAGPECNKWLKSMNACTVGPPD